MITSKICKSRFQDELRYCLITNLPESKDSDFSWKDFQQKNNNELVAILGNYVNRVFVLCEKFFNKKVPKISSVEIDKQIFSELEIIKERIESSIRAYKFREAMSYVMDVARQYKTHRNWLLYLHPNR